MITELTAEQQSKFPEYVKKWTDIGLSTAPANRQLAEDGLRKAYASAGLSAPKHFVWCGSPLSMIATAAAVFAMTPEGVKKYDKKAPNLSMPNVPQAMLHSIIESVEKTVEAFRKGVDKSSLPKSTGDFVANYLQSGKADKHINEISSGAGFGQHDASWLSFYSFFRDELHLKECSKLDGLIQIAESAGWYLPYEHICWVSERPSLLLRGGDGRLHSESGPSVQYPDGWEIFSIDGVLVPRQVVMAPREIPLDKIENESNADVRAIMIRRYGVTEYLTAVGASVVDVDSVEITKGGEESMNRALFQDRTGRKFFLGTDGSSTEIYDMPVFGEATSCRVAHEMLCGRSEDDMEGQS